MNGLRSQKGQAILEVIVPTALIAAAAVLAVLGIWGRIAALGIEGYLGIAQTVSLIVISALLWKVWRMHQAALMDELTGLPRREREIPKAKKLVKSKRQLAVGLLDLDHFKAINDTHGHLLGDAALRAASRRVQGEIKERDLIWRHGGEEIALCLMETGGEDLQVIGDRILAAVKASDVVLGAKRVAIKASLGLAMVQMGEDWNSALARADVALYAAKTGGRDRCVVSGQETQVQKPVEIVAVDAASEFETWVSSITVSSTA